MKKILGINDDRDFCQCCGKTGLARVVWIENDETGEIRHFGTTCATKNEPALFGEIKAALNEDRSREERAWYSASLAYKREGGTYRTEYDPKHPGRLEHSRRVPNDPARVLEIKTEILNELRQGLRPWELSVYKRTIAQNKAAQTSPSPTQPELFPA